MAGADVFAVIRSYTDITTPEGRARVLAACPAPDILVNNAGGPPRGDFREWDEADWMKAVNGNMITPIMLIKTVVDGMIARKFGRIVNITSSSVKSPIPELGMSNGARAGDPFEFGEACAFLCATSSGYIVGQNLLLDGGAFNSTLG